MTYDRKFQRMEFREAVNCQLPLKTLGQEGFPSISGGCLSCDLSGGGIQLRTECFIPLRAEVTLDFYLGNESPVALEGRVVWAQKVPHAENYRIGVEFVESQQNMRAKETVGRFIESLRLSSSG